MTSTVTNRFAHHDGLTYTVLLDVTSYATGGESITNAILGIPSSQTPIVIGVVGREDNVYGRHDTVNDTLILFDETAEVTAAADVGVVAVTAYAPIE